MGERCHICFVCVSIVVAQLSKFFVDNSKLQQNSRRIHLQFVGQIQTPRILNLTLSLDMH
jgi:hypothetical protein